MLPCTWLLSGHKLECSELLVFRKVASPPPGNTGSQSGCGREGPLGVNFSSPPPPLKQGRVQPPFDDLQGWSPQRLRGHPQLGNPHSHPSPPSSQRRPVLCNAGPPHGGAGPVAGAGSRRGRSRQLRGAFREPGLTFGGRPPSPARRHPPPALSDP